MPDVFDASTLHTESEPSSEVQPTYEAEVDQPVFSSTMPDTTETTHRHVDEYSEVMRQEAPSFNPLSAFIVKPGNISFDSQSATEKVILILRKHPITQIPWVLGAILFAFMPLLLASIDFLFFLPGNYQFAATLGWYMLLIGFSLEKFLQWFFNVYIITDERIIDVDFLSLIYKNISSAKIDKIEDVTAVTSGAIQSVFNFGTIKVQTAAEKNEFEFEEVPQPGKIAKLLDELILEEEREKIEGRVV